MEVISKKVASVFTYRQPLIIKELRQFFLASSSDIYIFSVTTGEVLHCLKDHETKVVAICRSPYNKNSIISCDADGKVISWAHEGNADENKVFSLSGRSITYFDVLQGGSFLVGYFPGDLYIFSSLDDNGSLVMEQINLRRRNQVASNDHLICGIRESNIVVARYPQNGKYQLITHEIRYTATCIACHPWKDTLAVGGKRGIIAIYVNAFSDNPAIANHHWHFRAVADLCFNKAGNELYSGGVEGVLMKWKLSSNTKIPMPRLGMPIQCLAVEDEQTVITHIDNDITIYRGENEDVVKSDSYVIRTEKSDCEIFLRHHPTNLLVTHGWPGYLQFYSLETNRRKFQVDITMENYVPSEYNAQSSASIVQATDISGDGAWIVTYDDARGSKNFKDYNLKFWNYIKPSQRWHLNSFIKTAHNQRITSLSLSRMYRHDYYCVSCSDDLTAKIWSTYQTGRKRHHASWALHVVKTFKKEIPTTATFHSDMSLMAVAFSNFVILYETEDMSSVAILCNDEVEEIVLQLQFARQQDGLFVMARTSGRLNVWNLAKMERFGFQADSSCMSVSPSTGIVALFKRKDPIVYLLRIEENKLSSQWEVNIVQELRISGNFITAALWVPVGVEYVLYYKTNLQEIYKLDDSKDEVIRNIIITADAPIDTPFSRLLSTTKTSLVEHQKANTDYVPSIKTWLEEKISQTNLSQADSFSELIFELQNQILADF